MNLQPIYPGGLAHPQTLPQACSCCGTDVSTNTGFFDSEAEPFKAYLCFTCAGYHLTYSERIGALTERDFRELKTFPSTVKETS